MLPILPVVVVAGIVGAAVRSRKGPRSGMTPERRAVFERALHSLPDPGQLQTLAAVYEKEGLTKEADLLRKRAALKLRSPETKRAHADAFRTALKSENPDAVERLAGAYHQMGATGTAARLARHARALRKKHEAAA